MLILYNRAIGPVSVDAVLTEDHSSTLTITRHPVENGTDIADHSYLEPKKVKMTCGIEGRGSSRTGEGRTTKTYEALLALQASRKPFDLVTGLRVYKNMLIDNLEVARDKKKANVLLVVASLSEIKVVSNQTSNGIVEDGNGKEPAKGDTSDKADPSVTRGNITPEQPAERSILFGSTTGVPQFNTSGSQATAPTGGI